MLKDAREQYHRASPNLETEGDATSSDDAVAKALRHVAFAGGVPRDKFAGLDFISKSDEDVFARLRELGVGADDKPAAREDAVPVDQVLDRLKAGWLFVSTLGPTYAYPSSP